MRTYTSGPIGPLASGFGCSGCLGQLRNAYAGDDEDVAFDADLLGLDDDGDGQRDVPGDSDGSEPADPTSAPRALRTATRRRPAPGGPGAARASGRVRVDQHGDEDRRLVRAVGPTVHAALLDDDVAGP